MKNLTEEDIIRVMREELHTKVASLTEEVDLTFKAKVDGKDKEVIGPINYDNIKIIFNNKKLKDKKNITYIEKYNIPIVVIIFMNLNYRCYYFL